MLAALLAVPAVASAAPANDDFSNSGPLSGSLPISETGSNVEATKEAEEPEPASFGFAASGHTVWYEWEAQVDGFVTVSTCGSSFNAIVGVYTGSALGSLVEVAGNFASLGPDCANQREGAVTFEAESGRTYEIQVDGVPSLFGSDDQGTIDLEVALTPKPANDDFSAATVLVGETLPNGAYAAGASGFNWNATKEPGEPAHAGDPGGASVWYLWTAPFSGTFNVTACGRFEKSLLGVYTGNAVDGLTAVASDDHSCSFLNFDANQGTAYHLAIDGRYEAGLGRALMGSVSINVSWIRPEPPREDGPPPQAVSHDVLPPQTTMDRSQLRAATRTAKFWFSASEPAQGFYCRLDKGEFKPCGSPRIYKRLKPGAHAFRVKGVDTAGNIDPSPAVARFKVPRPSRGGR
jgi:hypothetical protein